MRRPGDRIPTPEPSWNEVKDFWVSKFESDGTIQALFVSIREVAVRNLSRTEEHHRNWFG